MKKFALLICCTVLCCSSFLFSQNASETTVLSAEQVDVQVTYAEYLGKTPPLRNLVPMAPADPTKRALNKANRKEIFNFAGRGKYTAVNPNALPQGEDIVRQTSINTNHSIIPVEPLVNIDGMSDSNFGGNPPDPSIDVGKDYVLQMMNATLMQVRDKEGNAVSNPIAANTIWSQVGFTSAGDPIVMFDQEAERWIITEFPSGNQLLFAISETSDPLGSWMAWNFATPNFPDYPKYSIWPNAYCVTTNEQGPSTLPNYFIDREAILNGDASVTIQRVTIPGVGSGPGFQVSTPVDWTGPIAPPAGANPMILNLNDDAWSGAITEDRIVVSTFDIDFDNSSNTTVTTTLVPTAPFDTNPCSVSGFGFSCIPQAGGGGLDGLPEVIMNQVHYRNFGSYEAMVLNFITDATAGSNVSGIRWVEMRRTTGEDWSVYQEGTFAPDDGLDRFMAGICMDGSGNIGLAYNISGDDINVGVAFTGRRASDPLGQMTVDEYILAEGENPISSGARFGDYSHMSIDPTNDRTFWFTAQYAEGGGWSTRIAAFELRRDTTDLGPTVLVTPQSDPNLGAAETVTFQVKNFGLDTQSVFQVGYIFENGTPVVETVNSTLLPDSLYTHTFATPVDMSTIGDYEFKLFTSLAEDQAVLNDTLRTVVSKLSRNDAGISDVVGLEGVNCGEMLPATLVLTNFGTDTLFSATININFNGADLDPIDWVGTLLPGESEIINIVLDNILNGTNTVIASTSLPNGVMDEIQLNDSFTRNFEAITNGVEITLELLTDNFPAETTWEVTDLTGNVLYTGGPYSQQATLIEESFCLDPTACYNFTIFDSYGDGICCGFGIGNYSIVDEDGLELLSSTGEFGSSETNGFCATFMCSVAANFTYAPETEPGNEDGVIMIEVTSGVGPFQYSIDGGATFQSSNTFSNLASGDYNVVIIDDAECDFTALATVPLCALDVMASVTSENDDNGNGSISLTASNGSAPFQYSIDGGDNFQFSSIFANLPAGVYNVVVRDGLGCRAELEVTIDQIVPTSEINFGHIVEILPNPTEGVARINVRGLNQSSVFLKYEVFDVAGKRIQTSQLTRYDDTFTGQLSLVNYPGGTYYIRFENKEIKQLLRLVKQ